MAQDCRGLTLTAASAQAVAAFDHAVDGFLGYRADLARRVDAVITSDAEFGMAHCLNGYLTMMAFRTDLLGRAQEASRQALQATKAATPRERAHAAALQAWVGGEPERATAIWDQILTDHPRDILAFRVAHFVNFWLGRPDAMLGSVRAVERAWDAAIPGYVAILGCRCFALEECGHYLEAELAGRAAIRLEPTDLWAAHGVAHVLEMTGRRREGIAWVDGLAEGWTGGNNIKHHLWWHQALFHLELGDDQRVLSLYDTGFRELAAPLTQGAPDLYIDVQNAISMLFRLQRLGVDVGDRWVELADKAEARIGDCQSAFTLPHWMMALAATGREGSAQTMLAAMRAFARGAGPLPALIRAVALPVTEAVLANFQGRHNEAITLMRPVLGEMYRMGASHAQQDVLEQLFLDSALKADSQRDIRMLLERVGGRYKLAPSQRRGYAIAER